MLKPGMTMKDAARRWVSEFNAFPYSMIQKLMEVDVDSWREVTLPSIGDRVCVYNAPGSESCGEIVDELPETDEWVIKLDDGETMNAESGEFDIEFDSILPMWGTLWQFGDICDTHWMEDEDGIRQLSRAGFRVFEHDEWGFFFGIDGAGYDFYEAHWIPLYKARGLQWHDPKAA